MGSGLSLFGFATLTHVDDDGRLQQRGAAPPKEQAHQVAVRLGLVAAGVPERLSGVGGSRGMAG